MHACRLLKRVAALSHTIQAHTVSGQGRTIREHATSNHTKNQVLRRSTQEVFGGRHDQNMVLASHNMDTKLVL